MTLRCLGSGQSSFAGFAWFLIGADHEWAFWVTRSYDVAPDDHAAYEVRSFTPGTDYGHSEAAPSAVADEIANFCVTLPAEADLAFEDVKRARDLYWAYKSAKPE